ncbi:MAG: hypothetical protein ABI779_15235 [Acidobacteriota bacterium]
MAKPEQTASTAVATEAPYPQQPDFAKALGEAIVLALGDANSSRRNPPDPAATAAARQYGAIRRALRTHAEPAPAPPPTHTYKG